MNANRRDGPEHETRKDTIATGAVLLTVVLGIFAGAFTVTYHQVVQAAPTVNQTVPGGERG